MNIKKILQDRRVKDLFNTLSANMVSLFTGFITAFIIPKFLGIEDYGYLKIFTFYITYVGMLHLGFNDGIYVKYGNYDYDNLPKDKFKSYFLFLSKFQMIVAIVLVIISVLTVSDNQRKFIYISIAINMVIMNITTFFDFINQFTRRFKIYSNILGFNKISYLIFCLGIFALDIKNFVPFVVAQTIINLITLFLDIKYNKEIVFDSNGFEKLSFKELKYILGIGFLIMIANIMSKVILGIDRIFIDKFFTLEDFSMYSFVISLLNLFNVLFSALTTVVYPYLARATEERRGIIYLRIKKFLFFIVGLALVSYFMLVPIINSFLKEYSKSLTMLLILYPTVLFTSQILIVSVNYYKVMKLQKKFIENNLFALLTGVVTICIAYFCFKSLTAIAMSSLITFIMWIIYTDSFFSKKLNISTKRLNIFQLAATIILLVLGYCFSWYVGIILYVILFLALSYILLKEDIKEFLSEGLNYFN